MKYEYAHLMYMPAFQNQYWTCWPTNNNALRPDQTHDSIAEQAELSAPGRLSAWTGFRGSVATCVDVMAIVVHIIAANDRIALPGQFDPLLFRGAVSISVIKRSPSIE
jgi:hypothetical protein